MKTASVLLGVSVQTLRRWDRAGVLCAERHPANNYRVYDEDRLRAFMQARAPAVSREPGPLAPSPRDAALAEVEREGSIVGRAAPLAELDARIAAGERLVVVLGPPGVGKTRLVRAWVDRREPPPRFAAVGGCRGVEDLALTVAAALGAPSRGASEGALADDLERAARAQAGTIVVLDELENLDAAALRLVGRLADAGLVVVATSRVRPRLASEHVVALAPLEHPGDDDPAAARDSAGVKLFLDRARRGGGIAVIDDEVLAHAATIVRRLEGLPLAIELAASRSSSLGLERLRREIEASVEAVGTAPIDAPPQHRTLWTAVSSSLDRLDAGARALLELASLLPQGFELHELESFAGGEGDTVLEQVRGLIDHSMISARQATRSSATLSFSIHAVVREVVLAHAPPERRAALEARHAAWRARDARALAADRSTSGANRIARDEAGLRRAWEWAQRHLDHPDAASMATDLACALARLVETFGPSPALVELLDRTDALARDRGIDRARRAELTAYRGLARLERSQLEEARVLYEETLALAERGASPRFEAIAWSQFGWLAVRAGRVEEAERAFAEAERATRGTGDLWPDMVVAGIRAQLDLRRGRLAQARRGLERARALAIRVGDGANEASASAFLGSVAYDEGALREAVRHYDRAIAISSGQQGAMFGAIFRGYRATALHELGDAAAGAAYADALAQARRAHSRRFEALFGGWRAVLLAQQGRLDEAAATLDAADAMADTDEMREIFALHRGHLDLAHADVAASAGDATLAQRHEALACRRHAAVRAEGEPALRELRAAHRFLERALRALSPQRGPARLRVGWRAQWIEHDGARIGLARHRALRQLVWELSLRRILEPGIPAAVDALIAAAWPDERLRGDSGAHRLRVALSTLRRLGLRDAIVTLGDGYVLDPGRSLQLALGAEA